MFRDPSRPTASGAVLGAAIDGVGAGVGALVGAAVYAPAEVITTMSRSAAEIRIFCRMPFE